MLLLEPGLAESLPDSLHLRYLLGRAEARVELPHMPPDVVVRRPQPRAAALRDLEPPHSRTKRERRRNASRSPSGAIDGRKGRGKRLRNRLRGGRYTDLLGSAGKRRRCSGTVRFQRERRAEQTTNESVPRCTFVTFMASYVIIQQNEGLGITVLGLTNLIRCMSASINAKIL